MKRLDVTSGKWKAQDGSFYPDDSPRSKGRAGTIEISNDFERVDKARRDICQVLPYRGTNSSLYSEGIKKARANAKLMVNAKRMYNTLHELRSQLIDSKQFVLAHGVDKLLNDIHNTKIPKTR